METDFQIVHKLQMLPFKSYYVVWKPIEKAVIDVPSGCLNRTMQYGNCERKTKIGDTYDV